MPALFERGRIAAVNEHPLRTPSRDARPARSDRWHSLCALRELPIEKVAPWRHVDINLRRPAECVTDMSRSRELGFLTYQNTWEAFKALFGRLRVEKIIP